MKGLRKGGDGVGYRNGKGVGKKMVWEKGWQRGGEGVGKQWTGWWGEGESMSFSNMDCGTGKRMTKTIGNNSEKARN